ncbi:hypothetical protein HPB47_023035 [Ixodes persulcatus]|uniref:Uncharacterized protein n=1 Tax=Ixodes persulcatus TaxID=34615 RepID=A0AC60Q827_IXOPE|nr:hypothetical protein HPB47_023035 [Ixodes persulcatus]
MSDYESSTLVDTQTTPSSSSYDQRYRSHDRARRHRRPTMVKGPRLPVPRVPPCASLVPYWYPQQMPLQPPWRQPPSRKLSPLPPLVRSSRPPWLTKSPSVGELLVMYSAEQANKRSATRRTVAKPVSRKQEWRSHREVYDDDVGCQVPYIPVVAVAGILVVLLFSGAIVLYRSTARVISNHHGGSYVHQGNAPAKIRGSTAVIGGHTRKLPQHSICETDSCLWQRKYLLGKLNWSIQPCEDFYSHVCSDEWFKTNQPASFQSFVFKKSAATMLDLWQFLQEQPVNVTSSFASQASLIMRGCVHGSKRDKEWATFRKIFLDLGIQDWPYVEQHPFAEAHDIVKVADKLLGLSTFVSTSLKQRSSGGEISLYVDSPPILLRRYEAFYPTNMLYKYVDFVSKTLSLWKRANSRTSALALELVQLEQTMSDIAGHSARSVPIVHVIRAIVRMPAFQNWDWHVYFTYFLRGDAMRRSSGKVVLLDPAYFDKISILLSHLSQRVLINYVGYKLLVNLSPLLPASKANFMMPLSHQYHRADQASDRLQACMFLLERLYPFGTRSLIWNAMLTKSTAILSGDLAHDLRFFGEQARSEMMQCAAGAPWMSRDEFELAVFKIKHIELILTPSKEELALRFEPFEPATPPHSSHLLATYYNLIRLIRSQYWFAKNLEYFREPSTPTGSSFIPGFAYDPVENTVRLSPATVAFVSAISRRLHSTSVPFLLSPILRGIFSAMDSRGCTVDAAGDVHSWWTPDTKKKFMERAACIQDTFVAAARQYISINVSSDIFREENVMNAAVLRPMYNIFRRFAPGNGKVEIPGQTPKKLFFINWASTLCEPPQNDMYHKQSLVYKLGIPGKLSVNVALSRFPPFLEAFKCPPGSLIKSAKQCTFW